MALTVQLGKGGEPVLYVDGAAMEPSAVVTMPAADLARLIIERVKQGIFAGAAAATDTTRRRRIVTKQDGRGRPIEVVDEAAPFAAGH